MTTQLPLIVVLGETASGKSALVMRLARRFGGELICADSWTVYRDFDIGTAKPSLLEQQQIKHHLLDIAEPADGFSAVIFQKHAQQAIDDIHAREKLPILVGGTGLYIDSVIFDYSFLPPSDPGIRTRLNAMTIDRLNEYAIGQGLDLTDIDSRNKRRVIRHIENNGSRPSKQTMRSNTVLLGLQVPPETLAKNIEHRVDTMLTQGLEQEVRGLSDKYGWDIEPMKGIGYQEWQAFFAGTQDLEQTRQLIINHTRQLAKRQRTWFKRNNSIHWLASDDIFAESVDLVTTLLNK